MNQIVTFYSYKGGVGRSMALANVASILSYWQYRVLIVDWDLEAPGLERYFEDFIKVKKIEYVPGVIELLESKVNKNINLAWQDCIVPFSIDKKCQEIHLITSGITDDSYSKRVRTFDVNAFYSLQNGGKKIEQLREDLLDTYDFVLIDSRTGLTDFGGLCTIHLPDSLILLYTPTNQSLDGVISVANRAKNEQVKLPYDRERLRTLLIPSRIDNQTEYKITQEWMDKFAKRTASFFDSWIPLSFDIQQVLDMIKISYVPYFSYGEKLSVLNFNSQDPSSLNFPYFNISGIIANEFGNAELLLNERNKFLSLARKGVYKERQTSLLKIYMIFANKDYSSIAGIKHQISILKSIYDIDIWEDSSIKPGLNFRNDSRKRIADSDIFIILVTKSLIKSKYFYEELNSISILKDNVKIIPILVEATDFDNTNLKDFQFLPKSMKPLNKYKNKRIGYKEVLDELKFVIEDELKMLDSKNNENTGKIPGIGQDKILQLISQASIEEALNEINKILNNNSHQDLRKARNEYVLISSQMSRLKDLDNSKIINETESQTLFNQIVRQLLDLVYLIYD